MPKVFREVSNDGVTWVRLPEGVTRVEPNFHRYMRTTVDTADGPAPSSPFGRCEFETRIDSNGDSERCDLDPSTDEVVIRRQMLTREDIERRKVELQERIRSLPPREQLRLAADFAEEGRVSWAVSITKLALARLERGERP